MTRPTISMKTPAARPNRIAEWRTLARIAWRSALRTPLRSGLIVMLIGLAVGLGCFVAVTERTTSFSESDLASAHLGSADLRVDFGPHADAFGNQVWSSDPIQSLPIPTPIPVPMPTGSVTIEVSGSEPARVSPEENLWQQDFDPSSLLARLNEEFGNGTPMALSETLHLSEDRAVSPFNHQASTTHIDQVVGADWAVPLNRGRLPTVAGALPTSANEIAVPASRGLQVGDTVTTAGLGIDFEISGLVDSGLMLLPGSGQVGGLHRGIGLVTPAGLDRLQGQAGWSDFSLLIDTSRLDRPVAAALDEIQAATGRQAIYPTMSDARWVRATSGAWHTVPLGDGAGTLRPWVPALITSMFVGAQVALLAATAWAVGVRRRLRQFGQLGVTGASPDQVRRAVLVEATILGAVAAAIGALCALALAQVAVNQGWLDSLGNRVPDGVRVRPTDLLVPAVIGLVASVAAAWWPSQRLSQESPTALLTGSLPIDRSGAYIPRWGAVGGVVAVLLATGASMTRGLSIAMIPGAIALMLGVLMAIGTILSWFGRRADRLPLWARLIVRTADRQRSRSWTAVGAFVAILSIPIFFGASIEAYPGSYSTGIGSSDDRLVITKPYRGSPNERTWGEDFARFDEAFGAGIAEVVKPTATVPLHEITGGVFIDVSEADLYGGFVAEAATVLTPELASALGVEPDELALLDTGTVFYAGRWPAIPDRSRATVQLHPYDGQANRVAYDVEILAAPDPIGRDSQLGPVFVSERFAVDVLSTKPKWGGTVRVSAGPISATQRSGLYRLADSVWIEQFDNGSGSGTLDVDLLLPYDVGGPEPATVRWLALAVTVGLATLLALVTATLASVESKGEIAAMIAIGATPFSRRTLLAASTWYSMMIAAVLAVPIALALFWAVLLWDNYASGFPVPWTAIATVLVVIPAVVALLVGAIFGNGRPAVSRRLS